MPLPYAAAVADLFPARIVSITPEASELFDVRIDVAGTPLVGTHQRPGQYVQLGVEGHAAQPFALASAPLEPTFELLLKAGSELTDAVLSRRSGQTVLCSKAEGEGFPLDRARGRNVLLFATGSGISPIRSALLMLRRERERYGDVTLFFGARTPTSFAYVKEHAQWEADRIDVVRTVSRPGQSGWKGLTGYVQSHIPAMVKDDPLVFVCGQQEMVEAVTHALERAGVPKTNLYLNF